MLETLEVAVERERERCGDEMMVRTSLSIHHDSSVPQPKVFVPHTYDSKMQFLHSRHPKEEVVLEK